MLCIQPQVREHVAMRGRCPFGAQVQILGGEVVTLSSPSKPHPKEGPWLQLHLAIRDLNDTQLREALEELHLQTERREGMAAPIGSPLGRWWVPVGSDDANLGKWASRMGGNGDLASQCRSPWAPLSREGCWSPLSMLMARLSLVTPRINTFSGDATPGKTVVSFEQWNQEVQWVKDHYPEAVVWRSIISSLNGAAMDMAWYMGPTISVAHILWKL